MLLPLLKMNAMKTISDGAPPQVPAGCVVIVDMTGASTDWTLRKVSLNSHLKELYLCSVTSLTYM